MLSDVEEITKNDGKTIVQKMDLIFVRGDLIILISPII